MKRIAATSWRLVAPTTVRLPPGAEWHEAVISAGVQGYGGPPHGHESRWDWGVTASTLALAQQRNVRLQGIVRDMTLEQRAELWSDWSEVAAEMRKVRC